MSRYCLKRGLNKRGLYRVMGVSEKGLNSTFTRFSNNFKNAMLN